MKKHDFMKPAGEEIGTVGVETDVGNFKGKKIVNKDGDEIHMFLGIPYALPPVRFLPPKPRLSYGNFEAFEYGAVFLNWIISMIFN